MSQPLRRLTHDGLLKSDPVFLAGGDELVFTVLESPVQYSLMRLTLADGRVQRLHPNATTSEFEPAFSRDGRYAAFVQSRSNLNLKLVIRDHQEKREAIFDPGGGFAGCRSPEIAPDGAAVLFSIPALGGQQIASCDLQGIGLKHLTRTPGINNWPRVSPDGKEIAFASSREGDFEIYLMNSEGGDVRRLTRSPGRDVRPAWSPDGKRLAFTSVRAGRDGIFLIDRDGNGVAPIATDSERDD